MLAVIQYLILSATFLLSASWVIAPVVQEYLER